MASTPSSELRSTVSSLALGLLAISAVGCAPIIQTPVQPYTGAWYNNNGFPVDINYDHTTNGAPQPTEIGTKSGSSKSHQILFLAAWGDASVQSAAAEGNIKRVDHVDAKLFNILGVYSNYELVVKGE